MITSFPRISPKLKGFMHGADYNPDQWQHSPEILEEDIRLMKLAKCNVMAVGIFAWSALEPEEGHFTFGWLDRVLDRFAENGIYAWLATPSGARPAWMSVRYPEVLRVNASRVRNLHGGRHNHCYNSPVYREKTRIINSKLAERYAHHPAVIGWHISNEYGGDCHCEHCQEAFREWLKERYGTLEQLNQAWWTTFWSHTYSDWSQIESPAPHGETAVHGHNLDWKRFVTDCTVDFCAHEVTPLREVRPDLPVTANMMDWFEGLDYRKFANILDIISWDAYPTWHDLQDLGQVAAWFSFNHDLFRSLKGGQPFMLMESTPSMTNWQAVSKLKRPGMHLLSSLHAVAHGSDSVQYFQWRKSRGSSEKLHGAVVDHVGHEHTRVFRDVAELGEMLEKIAEIAGSTVPAQTAIIADWDNRWAVKDSQGPLNRGIDYENTVIQHYRAFWELGVPVDIIGSEDDLTPYKLIVAPMMYLCTEQAGAGIEAFVADGGTFVATYWSGIVNESDLCHLGGFPGPLRQTLGIWSEEIDGLHQGEGNVLVCNGNSSLKMKGSYATYDLCELIHTEGAEILAEYRDDFYAGRPALTVHSFGEGKAYYLATRAQEPFYEDFYGRVIEQAGIDRVLETDLPRGVTAQLRADEENEYVFLLNFSEEEQEIQLTDTRLMNMSNKKTESGSVILPVHGVKVLKRQKVNG
ncbi:beta-galactosidase [Paenibacillus dokdonensis]|uniref:beta-galactosidase n=1 Tax=Paenibacillus dokdonensis TaxID=2567944 RepID=UPI0010A9311B|nr:beta-galactosidase [Paenibacillus dokdonensis]